MTMNADAARLADLDVLLVDCQATAAAGSGHLLEIGWRRSSADGESLRARLIALPAGERIAPAVARLTGITAAMLRDGVEPAVAWRELCADAAAFENQPAPTVIHFARFESPFLASLAGGAPPLDIVCTHRIAARLLPDLPRRSLRALAGYFGMSVRKLRRSEDHVNATAFVWRALIDLLEIEDVTTWGALRDWLAAGAASARRSRRVWPMPRETRLALPDAPGIYRMLRTNGDVLYVGKAASLHHRVNSHFRHQRGLHERTLEMLSQARGLSYELAPTALEAALLECDEIKRLAPPYNVALTTEDRAIWFAAPGLDARSSRPTERCRLGPFPSAATLDGFAALARANGAALGGGRWSPDPATFDAGFQQFRATHHELSRTDLDMPSRLLRIGTRLWATGRRDRDADSDDADRDRRSIAWTPELVQLSLEWLVIRAALARRRAKWLTSLVDASVAWSEPGSAIVRMISIEDGEISNRRNLDEDEPLPIPPGCRRTIGERRAGFTIARFDRLRVLTTELKRIAAAGAPLSVRFGAARPLAGRRLARALSWV